MDENSTKSGRYFVAKCTSFSHLKKCQASNIWACSERKFPPQPHEILHTAFEESHVTLIFSVNNCHGWHGVAHMESPPGCLPGPTHDTKTTHDTETKTATNTEGEKESLNPVPDSDYLAWDKDTLWHRFKIHWERLYLNEHGEQCLPFSQTEHMKFEDGSPVNKARNYQELPTAVGEELCALLVKHYEDICELKRKKAVLQLEKQGPAFFEPKKASDPMAVWQQILKKVETMGTVLLACAFGSQRYNLSTEDSDMDMFIVYQAHSKDVLGFTPPKGTIKNQDRELCDYTIHEIHRFCELLLAGDPRCVETLFLHPSVVYAQADAWSALIDMRQQFLTQECLQKYLRDATGSNGLKQLQKWTASSGDELAVVTPRIGKLIYIILRLLQNARDVAGGGYLCVYRPDDSTERQILMSARRGEAALGSLLKEVHGLLDEIKEKESHRWPHPDDGSRKTETVRQVESWLLRLRYHSLKCDMEKLQIPV